MVDKAAGAFLTIGELADDLSLPQHILRYWETRFPQLKPLTRAGNRRYYRPDDVALARKINQLLNVQGYTVKGVQKLLASKGGVADAEASWPKPSPPPPAPASRNASLVAELVAIRDRLSRALASA
jgi:DNA-binding transcriptional MerR regulator